MITLILLYCIFAGDSSKHLSSSHKRSIKKKIYPHEAYFDIKVKKHMAVLEIGGENIDFLQN